MAVLGYRAMARHFHVVRDGRHRREVEARITCNVELAAGALAGLAGTVFDAKVPAPAPTAQRRTDRLVAAR